MERELEPEVMDVVDESEAYAAMDNSAPNAAFVKRLVDLGAFGRMIDLGTGPGDIPLLVCAETQDTSVLGVDLAESMLAIAEVRRELSPFAGRIEYRLADVKELEYDDDTFDTVFSNTILHHIPDPLPFLREARRVLRPGGVLLIRDLFRPSSPSEVARLLELHAADATPTHRELLRASLCAALTPDELRAVADAAGLADAELTVDTDRHVSLQIARA
jgi:ubiquinone/menaquinone biosynthesis C-methylase UbiE